jgi:hypothetical protein
MSAVLLFMQSNELTDEMIACKNKGSFLLEGLKDYIKYLYLTDDEMLKLSRMEVSWKISIFSIRHLIKPVSYYVG